MGLQAMLRVICCAAMIRVRGGEASAQRVKNLMLQESFAKYS